MPTVIRGNTHAPAVMIGERCAELIQRGGAGTATVPAETAATAG